MYFYIPLFNKKKKQNKSNRKLDLRNIVVLYMPFIHTAVWIIAIHSHFLRQCLTLNKSGTNAFYCHLKTVIIVLFCLFTYKKEHLIWVCIAIRLLPFKSTFFYREDFFFTSFQDIYEDISIYMWVTLILFSISYYPRHIIRNT